MFISHHISQFINFLTLLSIFVIQTNYCVCIDVESTNTSYVVGSFSPAVATWYESPTGPGTGNNVFNYFENLTKIN